MTLRGQMFTRTSRRLALLVLTWAVAVIAVTAIFYKPDLSAAFARSAPSVRPAGFHEVIPPGDFSLVMAVHPKCPCTRASLHELARLLAHSYGRVHATVILVSPRGAPAGWTEGDLRSLALQIPGVSVAEDADGTIAESLGADDSGDVLVYDAKGQLRFAGGITSSRGHEGYSAGQEAILQLARGGGASIIRTPVYGCPLLSPSDLPTLCPAPSTQPTSARTEEPL